MSNISRTPPDFAEFAGDRQFATTLARGLELLRCYALDDTLLSNKELAQRLKLPPSTVSRLTYTLQSMGYLSQDPASGKYRLGAAVLSLGFPLLASWQVRQRARAPMYELAQSLRGTVAIAIRDRLDMVWIEVVRRGEMTGHRVDIGRSYSMCATSVGRAYLAACNAAERASLLNQLQLKAPDEWARHRESLLENLALYPSRSCCTSVGDVYPDVQAVAVPLGRQEGGEIATINASVQRRKLDERWLVEEVAPKLRALAQAVA